MFRDSFHIFHGAKSKVGESVREVTPEALLGRQIGVCEFSCAVICGANTISYLTKYPLFKTP